MQKYRVLHYFANYFQYLFFPKLSIEFLCDNTQFKITYPSHKKSGINPPQQNEKLKTIYLQSLYFYSVHNGGHSDLTN